MVISSHDSGCLLVPVYCILALASVYTISLSIYENNIQCQSTVCKRMRVHASVEKKLETEMCATD